MDEIHKKSSVEEHSEKISLVNILPFLNSVKILFKLIIEKKNEQNISKETKVEFQKNVNINPKEFTSKITDSSTKNVNKLENNPEPKNEGILEGNNHEIIEQKCSVDEQIKIEQSDKQIFGIQKPNRQNKITNDSPNFNTSQLSVFENKTQTNTVNISIDHVLEQTYGDSSNSVNNNRTESSYTSTESIRRFQEKQKFSNVQQYVEAKSEQNLDSKILVASNKYAMGKGLKLKNPF